MTPARRRQQLHRRGAAGLHQRGAGADRDRSSSCCCSWRTRPTTATCSTRCSAAPTPSRARPASSAWTRWWPSPTTSRPCSTGCARAQLALTPDAEHAAAAVQRPDPRAGRRRPPAGSRRRRRPAPRAPGRRLQRGLPAPAPAAAAPPRRSAAPARCRRPPRAAGSRGALRRRHLPQRHGPAGDPELRGAAWARSPDRLRMRRAAVPRAGRPRPRDLPPRLRASTLETDAGARADRGRPSASCATTARCEIRAESEADARGRRSACGCRTRRQPRSSRPARPPRPPQRPRRRDPREPAPAAEDGASSACRPTGSTR